MPINCLIPQSGTPLVDQPPVDIFQLVRLVGVTRIALPKARVRLAAGRTRISREGQALCFFAGANSIFYGDKLLTAKNPAADVDVALLRELGLQVESEPHTESATDTKEHRLVLSSRWIGSLTKNQKISARALEMSSARSYLIARRLMKMI